MAPTVTVNGLTLCHQGSGGIATSTLPDICKTPTPVGPVDIAYVNIAMDKDLAGGSGTVNADGGNSIAIEGCTFSKSVGDEPGSNGGVSSGVNLGEASFISFSPDVTIEGKAVCRLSDKMMMNKENSACMGGIVIPPVVASGGSNAEAEDLEEEERLISVFFELSTNERQNDLSECRLVLTSSDDDGAIYRQEVLLKHGGQQVVMKDDEKIEVIFHQVPSGKRYTCVMLSDSLARAKGAGNMTFLARNQFIGTGYEIKDE